MERTRRNKVYLKKSEEKNYRQDADFVKEIKTESKKSFSQGMLKEAEKLCKLGMTNKQLSEFYEVSSDTISDWIKNCGDFRKAVVNGRAIADANVADATYQNAVGYEMKVEEPFKTKEGYQLVSYTKKFKPDVNAQKFWLSTRRKADWREKSESHNTYTVQHKNIQDVSLEEFTDKEKDFMTKALSKQINNSVNN